MARRGVRHVRGGGRPASGRGAAARGRTRASITRGTDFWQHRLIRYGVIYVEGACLLDLIERRMGRAVFDATLRDYALANRYGWSTAGEFRAGMDAASPVALGDLWGRFRVQ